MNALNTKPNEPSMEEILASIRRIIADDEDRVVAGVAATVQQAAPQAEPVARYAQRHETFSPPPPPVHFQPAPVQPEPAAYAAPEYHRPAPQSPQPAPQAHRPASHAMEHDGVGDAFRALEETARAGSPLTLEALVVDAIRPMLRDWLDAHLPGLVKEMVRDEIERITRRGR